MLTVFDFNKTLKITTLFDIIVLLFNFLDLLSSLITDLTDLLRIPAQDRGKEGMNCDVSLVYGSKCASTLLRRAYSSTQLISNAVNPSSIMAPLSNLTGT